MGVRNGTRTLFKGFVGGGWLNGGSLDDQDLFAGQIGGSDTHSKLDGDGLALTGRWMSARTSRLIDRGASVVVSPFIGFNYWQETVNGFGARCNSDDVGGFFCGSARLHRGPLLDQGDHQQGKLVVAAAWAPSSRRSSGTG